MNYWPVIGTLVASGTALLIAFVAYPWQKEKDRNLQLDAEKRQAYREFFATLQHLLRISSTSERSGVSEAMIENRKAFNALVFYAPIEVIEACRGIIDKLIEYNRARDSNPDQNHNLLFNEALRLDQEAMSMARADVGFFKGEDQEAAAKFLYGKMFEPGDGN